MIAAPRIPPGRWDVVVAGARCAGAAAAMLLARRGLRVLVVDPARPGSDTLSTHALMRGAVGQLGRWGLLGRLVEAGTPPVRRTTFQYGDDEIVIDIEARAGVDALYGPRRTVLDPLLQDAARAAGAQVVLEASLAELRFGADGRTVTGGVVRGPDGAHVDVETRLVLGADGIHSRVARLVAAPTDHVVTDAAATLFGYWRDPGVGGYRWHYRPGASVGVIPTNGGEVCVFTSVPPARLAHARDEALPDRYLRLLRAAAPELTRTLEDAGPAPTRVRGFAGHAGYLRRSAGPGWALLGDAGYFRDPITAHGISDAFRDAELAADAAVAALERGSDQPLRDYQATRDALVRDFLEVTHRIAAFEWDLDAVKDLHLELSRQMKRQVRYAAERWAAPRATPTASGVEAAT